MPYCSESVQYWHHVKNIGVVPARFIKSCIMQAVRQVVLTDVLTVLIVDRLDGDGQSFAPIGLHKIDTSSDWDWLLIKRYCIGMKACQEFRYKINQITAAIGVFLAFTRKKMFYFN